MSDALHLGFVALNRSLDESRRWDPEHRLLAERMASAAAVRHVEERHDDVEQSADAAQTRLDSPHGGEERRRGRGRTPQPDREEAQRDSAPEQEEGHLLDITA